NRAHCVIFSPDRKFVATHNHSFQLWDTVTGRNIFEDDEVMGQIACINFSSDGSRFATTDGTSPMVWDTKTMKSICTLPFENIDRVALNRDGTFLLSSTHNFWYVSTVPDGKSVGSGDFDRNS